MTRFFYFLRSLFGKANDDINIFLQSSKDPVFSIT